ncbi:hypothetical protein DICPUDRAFT_74537 [Dictyostelium purpureum]|uniref:Apoptosis inhibitor 5 n=1 Tax=Dictyostelium purpureum TaxID=5786 RepID=F0Z813_DICPU|nr:uncharacterized protein DICPUDRAFT_74537 [Dictyostelium purpureum]EGC39910.1 hypothetical protein DICPUDRAFT_74537 [Dictyostelium purpureum]|eukprot:XP_003283539.1 hypothetical protein DICPUDRAFT_74537 [Dictyostelium purpureum]
MSESMDTSNTSARNDQYINTYYDYANKLDSNPSFPDDDKLYSEIIDLSNKTKQTKRVAPQFISKYFKRFPTYQEKAIDCLIDLFESSDEDVVRINALKVIPTICRDNNDHIGRLVDILCQILSQVLSTDSKIETEHTKNSVVELYKLNSLTTVNSFLSFLEAKENGDDQELQTFTVFLNFIKENLIPLIKAEYSKSSQETQTFFRGRIINLIAKSVTAIETDIFFDLLDCFPQYKLEDAIASIDQVVPTLESQSLEISKKKIINFTKSLIYKSKKPHSEINCKIFELYSKKVFSVIGDLDETSKTELLSVFAQACPHLPHDIGLQFLEPIFILFKSTVPSKTTTPVGDVDLPLTIIEALLFSLSYLGSLSISSLAKLCGYRVITGQPSDMNTDPAKFEELLSRFRFLDEKCRETSNKAKKAMPSLNQLKDKTQLKFVKKTQVATDNILAIIQNLSKNPPTNLKIEQLTISSTIFKKKQFQQQLYNNNQQNQQFKFNPNQQKNFQIKHHQQQQQQQQQQNQQKPKSTRYSPYVTPGRRGHDQKSKEKQEQSGGLEVHYTSEHRTGKPSSFRGRGSKNY